jgi:hypothetical protein
MFSLALFKFRCLKYALHLLNTLIKERDAGVDFKEESSPAVAKVFESPNGRLLEFQDVFNPVKVPLDIASFFNLSTQIHKEPNIKMK